MHRSRPKLIEINRAHTKFSEIIRVFTKRGERTNGPPLVKRGNVWQHFSRSCSPIFRRNRTFSVPYTKTRRRRRPVRRTSILGDRRARGGLRLLSCLSWADCSSAWLSTIRDTSGQKLGVNFTIFSDVQFYQRSINL